MHNGLAGSLNVLRNGGVTGVTRHKRRVVVFFLARLLKPSNALLLGDTLCGIKRERSLHKE